MSKKYLWILDNGHGKATAGKRSPKLDDGRQLFEYEFNRDIVKRISEKCKEAGIYYHILVPEVDTDVSLTVRVKRANALVGNMPKIFVSVHSNAQGNGNIWGTANGIETYCYTLGSKGNIIADIFQKNLIGTLGWKNRGVKTSAFYVLKYTSMPAILSETGFYTNNNECLKLLDGQWRDKIALAHFDAIVETENL
ncbi:MAG: N-acetylmuramoyl-L-alanine amidase [Bacteroidales bacterium]|nr:N-acetylmuramoyl-L-alanine amidase [Bacteroidales bacterium]